MRAFSLIIIIIFFFFSLTSYAQNFKLEKYDLVYDSSYLNSIECFLRVYAEEDTVVQLYLEDAAYKEYKANGLLPMPRETSLTIKTSSGDSTTSWTIAYRYVGKYKKFKLKLKKGDYLNYYKKFSLNPQLNLNDFDIRQINIIIRNCAIEKVYSYDLQ